MAGAGYRTFTAGQILTAAQVQEFLQDQVVMVFDDSTARSSALGTLVAEGMLTYLKDTNSVEYYDSAAWNNVGDKAVLKTDFYALGDLITSSGSGVPVRLPIGLDNQVLTASSTGVIWADAAGGGGEYTNGTAFTSSGTFTVPAGVTQVGLLFAGGGGGGGGGAATNTTTSNFFAYGGGGAAASPISQVLAYAVTPGSAISVVVGAGGSGGTRGSVASNARTSQAGQSGGSGNVSSFDGVESGFGYGGARGEALSNGSTGTIRVSPAVRNSATIIEKMPADSIITTYNISNQDAPDSVSADITADYAPLAAGSSGGSAGTAVGGTSTAGLIGPGGAGVTAKVDTENQYNGGSTNSGGGGGGAGGGKAYADGAMVAGTGGAGATNSGGGGGGGGAARGGLDQFQNAQSATGGTGGSGGSGFVVVLW